MADLRIMLVDDNAELRASVKAFIDKQEGMNVCKECSNGALALGYLEKERVDVVVLDIIMPQMDGYCFMEELNRCHVGSDRLSSTSRQIVHMPHVIVMSALGRDDFIMRAVDLGARFYMIKPVDLNVLVNRIRDVCGTGLASPSAFRAPVSTMLSTPGRVQTIDEKLSSLFLTIGIPAHIKGYQFLREAVKMVVENPDVINRITKELYPGIARRFSTSASKVERAIRHAIEVAWSRGRIDTLNKAFGCRVATREDKPTNGEFIAMIADKLSMEQRSA